MENKEIHNGDWLSKLPKGSGFEAPEGYFDGVEDDFSTRLKEELFPNEVGFEVPEGYFNGLEDRILQQVELPKKGKVISLKTRILRTASIAAVFALMFTGYQFIFNQTQEPTPDEIAAWMDMNIGAIYTQDIIDELDESTDFSEPDFLDSSLESNSIETYFDQNDTYILIEESQGLFDELN